MAWDAEAKGKAFAKWLLIFNVFNIDANLKVSFQILLFLLKILSQVNSMKLLKAVGAERIPFRPIACCTLFQRGLVVLLYTTLLNASQAFNYPQEIPIYLQHCTLLGPLTDGSVIFSKKSSVYF